MCQEYLQSGQHSHNFMCGLQTLYWPRSQAFYTSSFFYHLQYAKYRKQSKTGGVEGYTVHVHVRINLNKFGQLCMVMCTPSMSLPTPSHVHSWYWNQGSCVLMNSRSTAVCEQMRAEMRSTSVLLTNCEMVVELGSNRLNRAAVSWKQ